MNITTRGSLFVSTCLVLSLGANLQAETAYGVEWIKQIGTAQYDSSESVTVDTAGNVYISGYTQGSLFGPYTGSYDPFLIKFDASGNELWSTQIATTENDYCQSVAVDAMGNAYISGTTWGNLGGPNAGFTDAFLTKLDTSGNELWSTQIGSSVDEYCKSVAVDAVGNAYISGYTFGSLSEPNAGGSDAFLTKFDTAGNELWTKQIGTTAWDQSFSVAVDVAGSVYISGSFGEPGPGNADAFLIKFDSTGNELWTKQIGTLKDDVSYSVAVSAAGNVYITGDTYGNLSGTNPNVLYSDAFLVKYTIPEPATLALLALGAPALLRRR